MNERVRGIRDAVRLVRGYAKEANRKVEVAKDEYHSYGLFDDCGESFKEEYEGMKREFNVLVEIKIKLEKFAKKVREEEKEFFANDPYCISENVKNRLMREYSKYGSLIIAYDFDYTVHNFRNEGYTYQRVVELLREFRLYAKFIVFTASNEERYGYIRNYLTENKIPFDVINEEILSKPETRKVYYNILLDDRAGLGESYKILCEVLKEIKQNEKRLRKQ